MGFAPVTNPAIVIVVTINGTEGHSRLRRTDIRPGVSRSGRGRAARHGRAQRFARDAFCRGWRSGRRQRCGHRRSWFFHPSPAGPSGRCRRHRRPTGGFREQCFGPAGSFSSKWKFTAGFCWAARAGLSRQDRAQRDSAGRRARHPGGVHGQWSGARAGSRARRHSALGELGSRAIWPLARPHDNRAGPPGRAAPAGFRSDATGGWLGARCP